uniref:Uncharacterized protein n=1 Tax=Arundo donax TaxID=35708 RepID=A0A0A9SJ07_ARUDO
MQVAPVELLLMELPTSCLASICSTICRSTLSMTDLRTLSQTVYPPSTSRRSDGVRISEGHSTALLRNPMACSMTPRLLIIGWC